MKPFSQILIGLTIFSLSLYNYLQSLNDLTQLRMVLPQAQQKLSQLEIEYQELEDGLHCQFNLKEMAKMLETASFCHLRRFQKPTLEPITLRKDSSLSKEAHE